MEAWIGPAHARRHVRRVLRERPSIESALEIARERFGVSDDDYADEPIFLFSAGWRSGSTLLQRLLCSSGDALIWGEPYDHCDLVRALSHSLTAILPEYPPDNFFLETRLKSAAKEGTSAHAALAESWIANLYPAISDLRAAHRTFFDTLYRAPAESSGYVRWGFKEVRLSFQHALYLKWLFPRAKFVFLVRNPYHSYRSFRPYRGYFDRYPDRPVLTARQFGCHWRLLAEGFIERADEIGAIIVRYEKLVSDTDCVGMLSARLGLAIDEGILAQRIASGHKRESRPPRLPFFEQRQLRVSVEPFASKLGYDPD